MPGPAGASPPERDMAPAAAVACTHLRCARGIAAGPDFEAAGPDFEAAKPDFEAARPDFEAVGPEHCVCDKVLLN